MDFEAISEDMLSRQSGPASTPLGIHSCRRLYADGSYHLPRETVTIPRACQASVPRDELGGAVAFGEQCRFVQD